MEGKSLKALRDLVIGDARESIKAVSIMPRDEIVSQIKEDEELMKLCDLDLDTAALKQLRDFVIKDLRSYINEIKIMKREAIVSLIETDPDLKALIE